MDNALRDGTGNRVHQMGALVRGWAFHACNPFIRGSGACTTWSLLRAGKKKPIWVYLSSISWLKDKNHEMGSSQCQSPNDTYERAVHYLLHIFLFKGNHDKAKSQCLVFLFFLYPQKLPHIQITNGGGGFFVEAHLYGKKRGQKSNNRQTGGLSKCQVA